MHKYHSHYYNHHIDTSITHKDTTPPTQHSHRYTTQWSHTKYNNAHKIWTPTQTQSITKTNIITDHTMQQSPWITQLQLIACTNTSPQKKYSK